MKLKKIISKLLEKEKLVIAIFLFGLFLRLLGTFPGYPLTHPDEPTIGTPSIRMVFEGNFRPQSYYYGSLLSLIYAVTYVIFFIPLSFIFVLPTNINYLNNGLIGFFELLQKSPPLHEQSFLSINYWARYDGAIISSLTIVAAYLVGKQLFNKPIALITAFLIAVNYRHVLSSRLILADAPAAFFGLFAVFLCINLLKTNSLKNYILAGLGIALSLSVKYFVYVIPTFVLCHLLSTLKIVKLKTQLTNMIFSYKVVLAIVTASLVFILINPYLLLAREEAAYYWAANSARYGLRLSLDTLKSWNLSYYSLYYLFYYGLGPVISVLTIFGFVWSFIRYPKSSLIISSVTIPYIYAFLIISGTGMVRNYSAIIPFTLFFSSVIIFDFLKIFSKILPRFRNIIFIVLIIAIGYQSLKFSLVSGYYLSKEQNMISLYKWLDSNLPDGSKILGPSGIFYPAGRNFEATRLIIEGNNLLSMEEIQKQGVPWIIMSSTAADVTENLLLTNEITKQTFFNKTLLNELTSNFYNTLVFREISNYRVVEFAKPLTQDSPFMVIALPPFWQISRDIKIAEFSFKNKSEIDDWKSSYFPTSSYEHSYNSLSLLVTQTTPQCKSVFYKITSPKIVVKPNNWYTLSAIAKRKANPTYKTTRNGFFRLDFYTSDDELIATYVTNPLTPIEKKQNLNAAGMSPKNSQYAKISFQIDSCLDAEDYTIDEVSLFVAKETPAIDKSEYPFYMKEATGFYWLPQL